MNLRIHFWVIPVRDVIVGELALLQTGDPPQNAVLIGKIRRIDKYHLSLVDKAEDVLEVASFCPFPVTGILGGGGGRTAGH